ncbi:hypothetical protein L1887_23489 [Cichorium endivia]|nr:hypothetical protein L1887_23489 [Cichorium endivia]
MVHYYKTCLGLFDKTSTGLSHQMSYYLFSRANDHINPTNILVNISCYQKGKAHDPKFAAQWSNNLGFSHVHAQPTGHVHALLLLDVIRRVRRLVEYAVNLDGCSKWVRPGLSTPSSNLIGFTLSL